MLDAFRDQKSKSNVLNSTTQTPVFSRVSTILFSWNLNGADVI